MIGSAGSHAYPCFIHPSLPLLRMFPRFPHVPCPITRQQRPTAALMARPPHDLLSTIIKSKTEMPG